MLPQNGKLAAQWHSQGGSFFATFLRKQSLEPTNFWVHRVQLALWATHSVGPYICHGDGASEGRRRALRRGGALLRAVGLHMPLASTHHSRNNGGGSSSRNGSDAAA